MVSPTKVNRLPGQTPASSPAPSDVEKQGQVISSSDLQALRRRIKPDYRSSDKDHGEGPDVEAQPSGGARSVSPDRRGGARLRTGRQTGRAMARPQTDRSFSKPPEDFQVRPAIEGSSVLVSADGRILHNLQGPIARAIYEHLCATAPRTQRPTVWLDDIFGRVPLKAIEDYLDVVDGGEGDAIFLRDDGRLDLGTADKQATDDTCLCVATKSSAP